MDLFNSNYLPIFSFFLGVIIAIIFIALIEKRPIKNTDELKIIQKSIDELEIVNKLHPLVVNIYKLFTNKDGFKYFNQSQFTVKIPTMGLEIWSENEISSRKFYNIDTLTEISLEKTKDEINNELSLADRKILDAICKRVIKNNKEFINRLFINE